LSIQGVQAQQEALFTHYAYNTLAVNPGYAGSRDALTVSGLHRSQWVGFEGAPTTQTVTLHSPVYNNKIGLGLSVLNDRIGPEKFTGVYADFAYKIPVSKKGKLALGLKGALNVRSIDLVGLSTESQNDGSFSSDLSKTLPNFGFGVYYSTDKFYAGVSTPSLLETDFTADGNVSNSLSNRNQQRHLFFIAGLIFNLNKSGSVKLKPTTFIRGTEQAPLQADLTATFLFNDKFSIGPTFRTGDSFGALIGYNITNQFNVGYSYDFSFTNTTGNYNDGSHEVFLRYDFIYNDKKKIRSPRYF